jgi:hypothetical protein
MELTSNEIRLREFILDRYCICDMSGKTNEQKIGKALSVLIQNHFDPTKFSKEPPAVDGVPVRKDHLESTDQIQGLIRKYYPMVSKNTAWNNLSFINPLQLATDILGISVSEPMARFIRSSLRSAVSFKEVKLPFDGKIEGIGRIRWNVK